MVEQCAIERILYLRGMKPILCDAQLAKVENTLLQPIASDHLRAKKRMDAYQSYANDSPV
jgi:hypothetical protein